MTVSANVRANVSVVIPAYNSANTIINTLQSVVNQTVPIDEIIVVDDGSRDDTVAVIQRHFPQVRVISQENAGPAAARNHGIRESRNQWVALLDADDSWLPHKIERQLQEIGDDVALIHSHTVGDHPKNTQPLNFDVLWEHNYIGTSTVLLNKTVFDEVGGFNERRDLIGAEDYYLWLRMAATGKRIVTVNEDLSWYTPAEGNLSGQVHRVLKAELLHIDIWQDEFGLDAARADAKRAAVLDEYARSLFWLRDLKGARKAFGSLMKFGFSPTALGFWMATFLPVSLLNLGRKTTQTKNEALLQAAVGAVR